MMLVARMIIAKPSAIRLYTQPTASPPTMRSTNWETLRAPIASPCVEGSRLDQALRDSADSEASVFGRCVRVGEAGAHGGIGDATRRFPFRGKVSRTMGRPLSRHPRGRNPSKDYVDASPQARDLHTL